MKNKKLISFLLAAIFFSIPAKQVRAASVWGAVKKIAPFAVVGAAAYMIGKSNGEEKAQPKNMAGVQVDKETYVAQSEAVCKTTYKPANSSYPFYIDVPQTGPDACVAFVSMGRHDSEERLIELAVRPDGTTSVPAGSSAPEEDHGGFTRYLEAGRKALPACGCVSDKSRLPANGMQ